MLGSEKDIKLVTTYGKVLVTILGKLYEITLGFDVGTDLVSSYGFFDGLDSGNLKALLIGESLEYTDGKVIGSDEGIKLGSKDGKGLGTVIVNVDGITLGLDVGINPVSLFYPFIILMIKILKEYLLETHWNSLMEKL